MVLEAKREADGNYSVFPHDPEHGGPRLERGKTMLEAAEKAMHPDIARKLAVLFELRNPTEKQIREHHYRKGDELRVIFF